MIKFKLMFLLLCTNIIYANTLIIDDKTEFYSLLESSQIYIDKTRNITIDDIYKKNNEFKNTNKKLLSYGYSPDFDVWIKFALKNNTNKNITKVLEYDNPLTTQLILFDTTENKKYKEGIFHIESNRKAINPFFNISLKAGESKIYYLKASTYITTLIIKLNLWETHSFYNKELKHQSILELFFGAMAILAIYNLFIYFFSRDISYLYYVFYIWGVIVHQLMYTGISYIYLLPKELLVLSIELSPFVAAIPIYALALFTKSFLKTIQYPVLNKILNIFLLLVPFSILVFISLDQWSGYRNIVSMLLLIYLVVIAIYATYKRNRQAYFILSGWIIIFIAIILMYLSSIGVYNIYQHYPHFIELAFILEATLFSIALSDKINSLQNEKDVVNKKLITQKESEKKRLKIQVANKTKTLNRTLDEKNLLLKELNHRVKNNMQTIVSLIRLQADDIEDDIVQNLFLTIQNRINAMSHLHELLYKQEDISNINAYEYFMILIEGLQDSYENEININYKIDANLEIEQAVSCGLILNELITNSFKYAFTNNNGNITIILNIINGIFNLNVSDDGVGYDKSIKNNSFGLVLVQTLVESKLQGTISINSVNGVEVNIEWRDNE